MVRGGGGIFRPSKISQTSSVQHARGSSTRSPRWRDQGAPRLTRGSPAPQLCQHPVIDPSHLQVSGTAPDLVGKSRSPFQSQPCMISTRFGLWDRSVPRMLSSPQIQRFLLVSPRRAEAWSRDAPPATSTGQQQPWRQGREPWAPRCTGRPRTGLRAQPRDTAQPLRAPRWGRARQAGRLSPLSLSLQWSRKTLFSSFFSLFLFFFSSCWQTRPANASLSCVGPAPWGMNHPAKG